MNTAALLKHRVREMQELLSKETAEKEQLRVIVNLQNKRIALKSDEYTK